MTLCPEKTQMSLGIHPVWSESSLCAQWVAKDPSFLHVDSKDFDQIGRMPQLISVFAVRTCHFVGFVMRRLIHVSHTFYTQFTLISDDDGGPPLSNRDVKNLVILTELPFVVAFEERVKVSNDDLVGLIKSAFNIMYAGPSKCLWTIWIACNYLTQLGEIYTYCTLMLPKWICKEISLNI